MGTILGLTWADVLNMIFAVIFLTVYDTEEKACSIQLVCGFPSGFV